MKNPDLMAHAELRLEVKRLRRTLSRIAKAEDGCLASTYQYIAQEALDFEDSLRGAVVTVSRVTCPKCEKLIQLCKDGTFHHHANQVGMRCKGTGVKYTVEAPDLLR